MRWFDGVIARSNERRLEEPGIQRGTISQHAEEAAILIR
jgi:hypothetical protein